MAEDNEITEEPQEEAVTTETVAEEAVPAETVAEEAAPTETVAEEAVPAETVAEEAASTETVAKVAVNELSKPAVIDIAALLTPISEDAPSGESVRYSGVFDEISEARRADEDAAPGDWQVELKVADFRTVIDLAIPVLEKESKDLQIAAWLSEALIKEHGFVGLRDSLKLMIGLQNKFWDTLFPEIDEGDMEGRANALAWMDERAEFAIKEAPITDGEGLSFFGWEDSKKFEFPDDLESLGTEEAEKFTLLKEQAEKENRTTAVKWAMAIAQSKRAFYEELTVTIEECWESYKELNIIIEEKFDRNQSPSLNRLKHSLETIQIQTNKLLEQKRMEEPDPDEESEDVDEGNPEGSKTSGGGNRGSLSTSGAIQNRRDALKRLTELAGFFRKTEPHSPVSYLVTRAVKWGNMPLDTWLQDVIKDETILFQLRQTLGFNTTSTEASGDGNIPLSDDSEGVPE